MSRYDIKTIYAWPLPARSLVLALVFLIFFYIGYHWDIASIKRGYKQQILKEDELKKQFEIIAGKKAMLTSQVAQYPSLQKILAEWKKGFISQDAQPELLNQILKVGDANHLYFTLFDPEDSVKADFYYKTPIKVIIVGDYHQISNFVSQLVNLPWMVVIDKVMITDENKNDVLGAKLAEIANAQNLQTAELRLAVYYLSGETDHEQQQD